MTQLIPTPVTLEDLINESSSINTFGNGGTQQADSPRTRAAEPITVAVTDDPFVVNGYWTQRLANGEWVRSGNRTGNDTSVSYTLPVNGATVDVHQVVYPHDLLDMVNYPPIK